MELWGTSVEVDIPTPLSLFERESSTALMDGGMVLQSQSQAKQRLRKEDEEPPIRMSYVEFHQVSRSRRERYSNRLAVLGWIGIT